MEFEPMYSSLKRKKNEKYKLIHSFIQLDFVFINM